MRESLAEGPEEIETLIALMARLPGLGPRSARRAVLHLIRKRGQMLLPLAEAMRAAGEAVRECVTCGNLASGDLCPVCADTRRSNGLICVVADVADLWAMERSGAFKGRYHVLGGLLSALGEMGPEELGIPRLKARLEAEAVSEVILALPATIDGQTTAHYLADALPGLSVTSLAQGVPVGGELDFLDEGTISAALRARGAV